MPALKAEGGGLTRHGEVQTGGFSWICSLTQSALKKEGEWPEHRRPLVATVPAEKIKKYCIRAVQVA